MYQQEKVNMIGAGSAQNLRVRPEQSMPDFGADVQLAKPLMHVLVQDANSEAHQMRDMLFQLMHRLQSVTSPGPLPDAMNKATAGRPEGPEPRLSDRLRDSLRVMSDNRDFLEAIISRLEV